MALSITPGGSSAGTLVASSLTPTAVKTAPYTAAVGDLAMMNVPGGGTVLNLPAAPADKAQVGYRAIGASVSFPLVINRAGSDTIGTAGATSASIPLADEVGVLQYDAANTRWLAVSNVKTQASLDGRYALTPPGSIYQFVSQGLRVRGANLIPKPTDVDPNVTDPWGLLWSTWDWTGWVKPQIDQAAVLGCNVIRIIGASQYVAKGSMTRANHIARWQQVVTYCQTKGISVYVCGGQYTSSPGTAVASTAYASECAALAAGLIGYSNVFGFDVANEPFIFRASGVGTTAGMYTVVQEAITAIRAANTAVAVAVSHGTGLANNASVMFTDSTTFSTLAAVTDFGDLHCYYAPKLTDIATWVTAWGSKPLILGEFGESVASGLGRQIGRLKALAALCNDSRLLGGLCWAINDQSASNVNKWGAFDVNGNERTHVTSILRSIRKTEGPLPLPAGADATAYLLHAGADFWGDRADANSLGNLDTGQPWTVVSPGWIRRAGVAQCVTAGASVLADLGDASISYRLSMDVTQPVSSTFDLLLRYVDANNYTRLRCTTAANGARTYSLDHFASGALVGADTHTATASAQTTWNVFIWVNSNGDLHIRPEGASPIEFAYNFGSTSAVIGLVASNTGTKVARFLSGLEPANSFSGTNSLL